MQRVRSFFSRLTPSIMASAIAIAIASPSAALELFDGRVQVHGFYEMQFRTINADFSEQWDVSQWYNVFDIEFELDLVQDTHGPLDLMQAYIRLEARYDCVYSRGCGMFRSMNSYGDRAKNLPRRLSSGVKHITAGVIQFPDDEEEGQRWSESLGRVVVPVNKTAGLSSLADVALGGDGYEGKAQDDPDCYERDFTSNICKFFATGDFAPQELILDDTFTFLTDDFEDYRFTNLKMGNNQTAVLGPWLPKNTIYENAVMAKRSNPFDDTIKSFDPLNQEIVEEILFASAYNGRLKNRLEDEGNRHKGSDLDRPNDDPPRTWNYDKWVAQMDQSISINLEPFDQNPDPDIVEYPTPGDPDWDDFVAAGSGWKTPYFLQRGNVFDPVNGRFLASYGCPNSGLGSSRGLPNDSSNSVSNCSIASPSNWDVELSSPLNGNGTPLTDWGGFVGLGGNWVQLAIDHESGTRYTPGVGADPARYISYDVRKSDTGTGGANWSPYNTGGANGVNVYGTQEKGALEFAKDATYGGALPFRPIPVNPAGGELGDVPLVATGAYVPSRGLIDTLKEGNLNENPYNISEDRRAWNRGYSQRNTKELKEAYLDIELFDSRLWMRLGKQTIVWGKTELFSFSDQFNPQDIALASLPSLEESRIALWSARMVYSLYSIGPLDDVRLEFAFNFDRNQPHDLGACGEAYTINAICQLTFGMFAHGLTGIGVAGVDRPPSPWEGLEGWELGGRLEWRWDRFSFAFAEFYGYDDIPTIERISTYERNIDPSTGLGRFYASRGDCQRILWQPRALSGGQWNPGRMQSAAGTEGCLTPGPTKTDDAYDTLGENPTTNALENHFANVQVFTTACYSTAGIASNFDPGACGLNVFNSLEGRVFNIGNVIAHMFAGTFPGNSLLAPRTKRFSSLVRLSHDRRYEPDPSNPQSGLQDYEMKWDASNRAWAPDDPFETTYQGNSNCFDDRWALGGDNQPYREPSADNPRRFVNPYRPAGFTTGGNPDIGVLHGTQPGFPNETIYRTNCGEDPQIYLSYFFARNNNPYFQSYGLSGRLSPEQEALIGCGPFWGTNCDTSGVDFLTADISVLVQSWPGIDGTEVSNRPIDDDPTSPDFGKPIAEWRTDDARLIQPGTVNFRTWVSDANPLATDSNGNLTQVLGAPRCTTNNLEANGGAQPGDEGYVLPGCRGLLGSPSDPTGALSTLNPTFASETYFDPETGYFHSAFHPFFHPFDPTGNYPLAACTDDPQCWDPADDDPAYHNRWEAGYDIRRDGNPLGVSTFYSQIDVVFDNYFPEFYCRYDPNRNTTASPRFSSRCISDVDDSGTDQEKFDSWGFDTLMFSQNGAGGPQPTPFCRWEDVADRTDVGCYNPDGNFRQPLVDEDGDPVLDNGGQPIYPNEDRAWFYDGLAKNPINYIPPVGSDFNQPPPPFPPITGDTGEAGGDIRGSETGNGLPQTGDVGRHPYTGQVWQNELAALSWNMLMFVVGGDEDYEPENAYVAGKCSYITPQYCDGVRGLLGLASLQHRDIRAGGNGTYGRRSMTWHGGGEIILKYQKRNVLGFAVDFAEDITKTNWSLDFTWIDKVNVFDAYSRDNTTALNQYALTISMDRPTFINFLNPNNTFFFNTQWFVSYLGGWQYGMTGNGAWNVLGTVTALTGYFQDRLQAQGTVVYDFRSNSGGVLPQISYRINQDFTVTFGAAIWFGREQLFEESLNPIAPFVNDSYKQSTNQLIANIRDRDELFMRIRYTF